MLRIVKLNVHFELCFEMQSWEFEPFQLKDKIHIRNEGHLHNLEKMYSTVQRYVSYQGCFSTLIN